MFYAQIDTTGTCVAVTQTAGPVDAPHMIERPAFDESELGKRWNAEAQSFESVPDGQA